MATEATKTKKIWSPETLSLLQGRGIDIGCGVDPILEGVDRFDKEQGDANEISRFVSKRYDFVFSSHTLEHMHDPKHALREWYELVKPGGHLIVIVPDEDLYEQGCFPSRFNADHKFTFTLSKVRSWSPKSINVIELVNSLGGELKGVELQDHGFDRKLINFSGSRFSRRLGRLGERWVQRLPGAENLILKVFRVLGALIDQTNVPTTRLAQIQFIVQKPL